MENKAIGKRTGIDFSKHEVIVCETEGLLTHYLKVPGTVWDAVKFINTSGIMAVTGDYGNWIFCREFHPSAKGGVSDGYWIEKLEISSRQHGREFSVLKTREAVRRELDTEENLSEVEKEYLEECISVLDEGEFEYSYHAYRNNVGRYEDSDGVPFEKETDIQLQAVFDAFDEMCRRMKEQEISNAALT